MHICAVQEKLYSPSSSGPGPLSGGEAVHNDLSCQCSGTVCICGTPITDRSYGGPDADHPKKVDPKEKQQPDSIEEENVCQGETFRTEDDEQLHEQSFNVQQIIKDHFQCEIKHWLCEHCRSRLTYCPCHSGFGVSNSSFQHSPSLNVCLLHVYTV